MGGLGLILLIVLIVLLVGVVMLSVSVSYTAPATFERHPHTSLYYSSRFLVCRVCGWRWS